MKNKITQIIKAITIALYPGSFILAPRVFAYDNICSNPNVPPEVRAASGCTSDLNTLDTTIINLLNAIIAAIGIVAVIFIVMGGINYITSAGDSEKTKKAKNTILYACIGLAVCALAFAIVNFAINSVNDAATTTP